ncbi:MAG: DUF1800 domain-containing protein [Leeuwenhoekiella sp.]
MISDCNTATIAEFVPATSSAWSQSLVRHVYRRLAYGASVGDLATGAVQSPAELIDALINDALAHPNIPQPSWAFDTKPDYENTHPEGNYNRQVTLYRNEWRLTVINSFYSSGLKARMTLFWHNHFVTELTDYRHPGYLYEYWDLLQTFSLGNFRDFVAAIGLTPAMLEYLNGRQNKRTSPNENYARELYELFTLGVGNGYTQKDIEETARALTGYTRKTVAGGPITFANFQFDKDDKTIFGQTGNWGYDDVIRILFEERPEQIARFVCEKFYGYFISPEPQEAIVNALAQTFLDNNFEIAPVLRQLFKSQHFFDESIVGCLVKSPYDLTVGFGIESGLQGNNNRNAITSLIFQFTELLGQTLFNPVDVAGWPGDKQWINSSTISGRWIGLEQYLQFMWIHDEEQFRELGKNLSGDSSDPEVISRGIIDSFLTRPLQTETEYQTAATVFKWEVPENYFEDSLWNLNWESAPYQVYLLLVHITQLPEFQLK